MTEPIKLPPEFSSGNSIPVERATITRERMVEILTEAVEPYIETLFKIGEHLGINYQAARTDPGKPSDVYIAAIEAYQAGRAALQSQDREDAERYRWLKKQCEKTTGGLVVCGVRNWELEPWSCDHLDQDIDRARNDKGDLK